MEITTQHYIALASRFQTLAHPVRLHILDELRRAPACVCHLQTLLDRPQVYISQQLRVLRQAGFVESQAQGLNVYYHLTDPEIPRLLEALFGPAGTATVSEACPCPTCRAHRDGAFKDAACD